MLLHLSVRNFVLIDSLDIPFEKGLCVLTGETGAGKSILLDALGFVLGDRANQRLLRHGEQKGSVTASFDIAHNIAAKEKLAHLDMLEDESELLLRRTLDSTGKSRAYVNDAQVNMQTLKELSSHLLEIHGQHEQSGLLSSSVHRQIIDEYGRLQPYLEKTKKAFQHYILLLETLELREKNRVEAAREEDYLRFVVSELEKLDVKSGEEAELAEKRSVLMHREKMSAAVSQAMNYLSNEQDIPAAIQSAQSSLLAVSQYFPSIQGVVEMLERANIEVNEAVLELGNLGGESQEGDAPLELVEERLFALRGAARKYGVEADALPEFYQQTTEKLDLISNEGGNFEALKRDCEKAKAAFKTEAEKLHKARVDASKLLEKRVIEELSALKMQQTKFEVSIAQVSEEHWSENGADKVQFTASMNPGMPLQPIAKVASGGELSRFMLAFKVALSHVKSVPSLIFDEVDTGIGGAVADAVGKRLDALGKQVQVLVVTHQPQVASKGVHHLKVMKTARGDVTTTNVVALNDVERQEELARMLAGEEITTEARAAAGRLLQAEGV